MDTKRTGRQLSPQKNSPEADIVMTPPDVARLIVEHFAPRGRVLDPCRGEGAFLNAFPEHCEPLWCEIREGRDFYRFSEPVDWIVSNPPWSEIRRFCAHAFTLADDVVFLSTLTNFVTKARLREMQEAGFGIAEALLLPTPPKPWPASGFQVAAVHMKRGKGGAILFTDAQRPGWTPGQRDIAASMPSISLDWHRPFQAAATWSPA